jgi:hypothetical protein
MFFKGVIETGGIVEELSFAFFKAGRIGFGWVFSS